VDRLPKRIDRLHPSQSIAYFMKKSSIGLCGRVISILGLMAIVLSIYLPAALYLEAHSVPIDKTVLTPPFERLAGNAFAIYKRPAVPPADTVNEPRRSRAVVFENGTMLGPGHSPHSEINAIGRGRYSYWSEGENVAVIVFSTSDNSDPNTNGKTYRLIDPDVQDPYKAQLKPGSSAN